MEGTNYNSIKLQAEDAFMRKMAAVNIGWMPVLWELINNPIQAAEDRELSLDLQIVFNFKDDADQKIDSIEIKDKSGGIHYKDIEQALTPASIKSEFITLSEHGMGLNIAIEFLTQDGGEYQLSSYCENESFQISDQMSFHNPLEVRPIENKDFNGLELVFSNLSDKITSDKFPDRATSKFWKFWALTCAKYRFKYDSFKLNGRDFKIDIVCLCGERIRNRTYTPVRPELQNPISGKNEWITSFVLKDGGYEIEYKLGAANGDKGSYNVAAGDNQIFYQIHPYRISMSVFGFDTVYQDVIIQFNSNEALFFNDNLSGRFSSLRGEKIIRSGGESFFTKDGVKTDETMKNLDDKAVEIFKGNEPHPVLNEKIDFIEKYVHLKRRTIRMVAPEVVVKFRHRKVFEDFDKKVEQEVPSIFGKIDMIVDNKTILEHKVECSTTECVLQTFKYMLARKDIEEAVVYAPNHSDNAVEICSRINFLLKQVHQEIKLKILANFLTNPNLLDEEKELL